jgi:HAE1 family hydrophobic/amphiphilic exporter-1
MSPTDDPAASDREHLLPRFSLERRVTVLVLLLTALVVGFVATAGIPLELLPRGYDAPTLTVRAVWPESPSQEMLDKVTLPLEEELSTVSGLADIFSFATTGFTRVAMSFKLGTDMDVAYREVRDRVERAKARVPDEVDRVMIHKQDAGAFPVMGLGLAIDPGLTDAYDLVQTEIVLPIQRIDGVASTDSHGLEQKEVLIELDRERTAAAGLNIFALGLELERDNFTLASGHVYAGGKKLLLRSVAKYPDVEALRNRPVGPSVRLRDIATVRYDEPEKKYRARIDSFPAVALWIFKEGEANAIEVSDAVMAAVERMQANPRLRFVEVEPFFNQGELIRESLRTLMSSGAIGGALAFVVLFFFLRRFRLTMIIALAIPLSMVIGLTVMYFAGETLNILSLLGLMISVGLLVDNSVVVAENIFRLHGKGEGRRQAAIRGAGQISLAIVMATLTTIIVFLPVSLVEGQGQFFMLRLAIPITVSLLASLLVALVFIPLSVYLTLPAKGITTVPSQPRSSGPVRRFGELLRRRLRWLYDHTLEPMHQAYNAMLGFFLRRRMDLMILLAAVIALSALPFGEVELVQVQEEERGSFQIEVELPQATTLEEAAEYFDAAEELLEASKEELDLDGYFIFHLATSGQIHGWFNRPRRSELSPRKAIERVQAGLPERPGVKTYTGLEKDDEKESKGVEILTLYGQDSAQLEAVAAELEGVFVQVDGVLGVKRSSDRPAEEMALVVDRERAQRLDLNPEAIAGVVRNSLGGRALPKFYRDGREIPVRVRFEEADRENLAQLYDFRVPTNAGELVSLQSVTEARRLDAPRRISRRNKQLARTITLELEEGREEEARSAVNALAGRIDLPEGVRFGAARRGPSAQEAETGAMIFAMQLSVVFIYLLMGFLFESFILPLSIVTTIPLAAIGVYWIHYLLGYDLDGLGLVGMVLLIGVVVNNGIVLVDYINRLRSAGAPRREAILAAADRRFRPIMMTALTTVGGMVPLTVRGTTSIGLSYTSFGLTLIGGMTTATLLTLLVVPVAYTLFDDLRGAVAGPLRRAAGRRRLVAAETV